jgi:TolA-binding protein
VIRVINYTRAEVAAGRDPLPTLAAAAAAPGAPQPPWQDDKYLIPVLPEDPLLAYDFAEDLVASSSSRCGRSKPEHSVPLCTCAIAQDHYACACFMCRAGAGEAATSAAGASSSAGAGTSAAAAGPGPSSQQQQQQRVTQLEEEVEALRMRLAALSQLPLLRELMEGQEGGACSPEQAPARDETVVCWQGVYCFQVLPWQQQQKGWFVCRKANDAGHGHVAELASVCCCCYCCAAVEDAPAAGAAPSSSAPADAAAGPGPSSLAAATAATVGTAQAPPGRKGGSAGAAVALAARSRVDQLYFESYSYFDIHREMLGDKVGPWVPPAAAHSCVHSTG